MSNNHKSIKQFMMQLITPLFLDTYRKVTGKPRTWIGIFPHYRDIKMEGDCFENNWYCDAMRRQAEEAISISKEFGTIPAGFGPEHRLLSLLVSTISREKTAKILDFGGGVGIAYIHLLNSMTDNRNVDYHIVEGKRLSIIGRDLFKDDHRVHFYTALPSNLKDVDIIYMSGVLQFIEDYSSLLKSLPGYKAKYILLTLLPSGDIPTFASAQVNMPGIRLSAWFINVQEIINIMSACGYSLIFKAPFEYRTKQNNFPIEYRLKCHCSLLFALDQSYKTEE